MWFSTRKTKAGEEWDRNEQVDQGEAEEVEEEDKRKSSAMHLIAPGLDKRTVEKDESDENEEDSELKGGKGRSQA
jgi:hypothetical protein